MSIDKSKSPIIPVQNGERKNAEWKHSRYIPRSPALRVTALIVSSLVIAVIALIAYSGNLKKDIADLRYEASDLSERIEGINNELDNLSSAHRHESEVVRLQREALEEQLSLLSSKLSRFIPRKPSSQETLEQERLVVARRLINQGQNDSAVTVLNNLSDSKPTVMTQYETHMIRGNVNARHEDYRHAAREYKKAEAIAILMQRPDLSHQAAEGQVTIDRLRKQKAVAGQMERKNLLDQKLEQDREVVTFVKRLSDRSVPLQSSSHGFEPNDRVDLSGLFVIYPDEEKMVANLDSLVRVVDIKKAVTSLATLSNEAPPSNNSWKLALAEAALVAPAIEVEQRQAANYSVSPWRSQDSIQAYVVQHAQEIQDIFWTYKRRDKGLGGKISFRFGISNQGEVAVVQPLERNWSNQKLGTAVEMAIANQMKRWKFKVTPADQGDVYGTATYVFPTN